MVPSAAFLTPNAARVQAQLSHKLPWDLKKFGWVEEISFTPPKPFTCVGCRVIFAFNLTSFRYGKIISCGDRWMDIVFWLAIILYSFFEVFGF
jgi:hypothetical protein